MNVTFEASKGFLVAFRLVLQINLPYLNVSIWTISQVAYGSALCVFLDFWENVTFRGANDEIIQING